LAQSSNRPRMIILVSKYDHCLVDLLYRHQSGELACDIPLIVSNHPDNQPIADFYKIPYAIISITKDNKPQAEDQIQNFDRRPQSRLPGPRPLHAEILSQRFRQPLSAAHHQHSITHFCPPSSALDHTIKHSSAAVKLIGATSHYVTEVLDDGTHHRTGCRSSLSPRYGRRFNPQRPRSRKSRTIRAVRWHIENRVLLTATKTRGFLTSPQCPKGHALPEIGSGRKSLAPLVTCSLGDFHLYLNSSKESLTEGEIPARGSVSWPRILNLS